MIVWMNKSRELNISSIIWTNGNNSTYTALYCCNRIRWLPPGFTVAWFLFLVVPLRTTSWRAHTATSTPIEVLIPWASLNWRASTSTLGIWVDHGPIAATGSSTLTLTGVQIVIGHSKVGAIHITGAVLTESISNSNGEWVEEAKAIDLNSVIAPTVEHTGRNIDGMITIPIRSICLGHPLSIDPDVDIACAWKVKSYSIFWTEWTETWFEVKRFVRKP